MRGSHDFYVAGFRITIKLLLRRTLVLPVDVGLLISPMDAFRETKLHTDSLELP
jgi:hypothetical protein